MIELLTILQHADSAFPSGSFAFSNGIEGLQALGEQGVGETLDRRGLENAVTMYLRHRWAPADRVAMVQSFRAGDDFDAIAEIDHAMEAASLSEPLRTGSKRNGRALLAAHLRLRTQGTARLDALIECGRCFGHLPVVQGVVWRALRFTQSAATAASAYTTAAGLIAAAVRLGAIGAIESQAVLSRVLAQVGDVAGPVPYDARIESFTPWVDIAAASQARAQLRLFAS